MPFSAPLCVVINGPSAVGKSTLAAAIQERWSEPLLRFGVDELYRMVPAPWAGGTANASHADRGFSYQEVASIPGARRIVNGADAVSMLYAMNAAILGVLRSGVGVVVDGQAFEPVVNRDLETGIESLRHRGLARVAVVELTAADDQLVERQRHHAHPAGLALHQVRLPKQAVRPDLIVDTTNRAAAEVADQVLSWLTHAVPVEPQGSVTPQSAYSYGTRDVQPGYESTWQQRDPGLEPDPWDEAE